ncbi:hypothetical protein Glove_320g56 [Diversispora epigaea]|uniref:Uncharacterized protein n=1 Tax=Diversispora epigaea TaxID=1348612 RepID=A0A397HUF9_9GLOM|nr:hypothetical protein Glove_320g56 [Diversispora epigaea]
MIKSTLDTTKSRYNEFLVRLGCWTEIRETRVTLKYQFDNHSTTSAYSSLSNDDELNIKRIEFKEFGIIKPISKQRHQSPPPPPSKIPKTP